MTRARARCQHPHATYTPPDVAVHAWQPATNINPPLAKVWRGLEPTCCALLRVRRSTDLAAHPFAVTLATCSRARACRVRGATQHCNPGAASSPRRGSKVLHDVWGRHASRQRVLPKVRRLIQQRRVSTHPSAPPPAPSVSPAVYTHRASHHFFALTCHRLRAHLCTQ